AGWDLGALGEPAELVVSELVTNAIQACKAAGARRQVRLRLVSDRARVLIEVQDGSPQPPVPVDATAEDESGHGLRMVEAMSAAWDWYPHRASGGKVVWALVPAACWPPATGPLGPVFSLCPALTSGRAPSALRLIGLSQTA